MKEIPPVRHIAVSYLGSKCAVATFEHNVYVVDILSGQLYAQLRTCLEGGYRLAISEDGNTVIAGSYHHGIEAYRADDARLLWRRSDLRHVQYITFDYQNKQVFASFDGTACNVLEADSGRTIRKHKVGVDKVIAVSFYHADIAAFEKNREVSLTDLSTYKQLFSIKKESFSILSMTFTPTSICTSEVRGPIRCHDIESGSLLWRYDPPDDSHFVRIAYSEGRRMLFGILYRYTGSTGMRLFWFDIMSGTACGDIEIAPPAYESGFALKGNFLLTSDGNVYDLCVKPDPVIQNKLDFSFIQEE